MCVYVCMCVYTSSSLPIHLLDIYLFIYLFFVRHLGCSHTLPIVNSVAVNIGVHIYLKIKNFFWIYTQEYNYRIICKSF